MDINVTNNINNNNNVPLKNTVSDEVQESTETSCDSVFNDELQENKDNKLIDFIKDKYNKIEYDFSRVADGLSSDVMATMRSLSLDENIETDSSSKSVSAYTQITKESQYNVPERKVTNEFKISKNRDVERDETNINIKNESVIKKDLDNDVKSVNTIVFDTKTTWFNFNKSKPLENVNVYDGMVYENNSYDLELTDKQVFTNSPSDNVENSVAISLSEKFSNEAFKHATSIGDNISLTTPYTTKKDSDVVFKNSAGLTIGYSNAYDFSDKSSSQQLDFTPSLASSLTYTPNNRFNITFSGKGAYSISTNKDSYSVGSGIDIEVQPFKNNKNLKFFTGASYTQSDYVNAEDSGKLKQAFNFDAKLQLNKHFTVKSEYELRLDNNSDDSFSIGFKMQ